MLEISFDRPEEGREEENQNLFRLTVLSITPLDPKPIRKRQRGRTHEGDERGAGIDGAGGPGG